ncbi:MAG: hypothetical protein A2Y10_01550 [Planctomycetes bacterium GWF2_41_51]|nr:MAG: hypothetical protein A2Y10_01550 [Planctomycetes bacterium GWF2_41_51]HBG25471.1 hypothetical protein [Phycisphaerales bacterium]
MNVTARKKKIKAVQQSDFHTDSAPDLVCVMDKFRELFENLSSAVAVYEPVDNCENFIIKECNQALLNIEAIKRQDIIGKRVTDVFPGVKEFGFLGLLQRVYKTGKAEHYPAAFYKDDRICGWKENYIYKLPSGEVVAVYDDVTERKQMEYKLRHESEMRNILLENLPCTAMILKRESREIVYSNEAARKIGAVPGQKCYEICAKRNNPCPFCKAPEVWKSGISQQLEIEYMGKWFEGIWVPLTNDLFVHYIFDITKRKETEEELRKINEALKIKTEHAREMAAEAFRADRAKSEFLATMSHELRTPLNAVIGFSEMLTMELTSDHKKYAEMIYSSGQHLLVLISDILDLSRIEAEKVKIKIEPCSLKKLIKKIEFMLRPFAAEKNLKFEIHLSGLLPKYIITDSARLEQCIVNVVNNAIKFTEQGHIYISISMESKNGNSFIRFDVEDTGIGVSREFHTKIFDSFVQEDGTFSRKYGGTGLGLTISSKLVKLLGGSITMTSEKGKGSIFTLLIPVNTEAVRSANQLRLAK